MVRLDHLEIRFRIHGARRGSSTSRSISVTPVLKSWTPGTREPPRRLIDERLLRRVESRSFPEPRQRHRRMQASACAATAAGG
jgi:hypothetical protein